ncbi:MAG: TonB-dependent receptor plug domain-containing protein, partial [Gammaproteobacteria bacterium]
MFNRKMSTAVAAALTLSGAVYAEHQELPTIVVEGTSVRPGTFGAAPDSSSLVDTASLLKRVPGANVARNGPLTGIAQYRGMAGNRINVALDGVNMKEVGPNSMDPPLSHIPAPLTGSLQLYRGIAPVSSGIDSIGGSMKAESKKGRFAEGDGVEVNGMASMGYSSAADGYYGVLLGAVATQNHKLYLSGSREKGRDYRAENNDKQVPTQYDRDAFTTGYGFQQDGHEFGINYSNNNTGNTGTPALPMDIIYIRGGVYDTHYSWDLGDGYKLKTNLYYQKMRHLMNNFTVRGRYTNLAPAAYRQNRTNVEAGGWDIAFSMPMFDGNMSFGFNGDQANHDALITNPSNAAFFVQNFKGIEKDRYSIFSEWKGDIAQDLSVELGA